MIKSLSVADVAKRLQVGRTTVIRLIESNEIEGYKYTPRGWWKVTEQSLKDYEGRIKKKCILYDAEAAE